MKFFVFLGLLALVMACEEDYNDEDCSEERAEACVEDLFGIFFGDYTKKEICKAAYTSVKCWKNYVHDCLGERDNYFIDDIHLPEMRPSKEDCGSGGDCDSDNDEIMEKCFQENLNHMSECIEQGSNQALSMLQDKYYFNKRRLHCMMAALISNCFVQRLSGNCGKPVINVTEKELKDIPEKIKRICDESGGYTDFALDDYLHPALDDYLHSTYDHGMDPAMLRHLDPELHHGLDERWKQLWKKL